MDTLVVLHQFLRGRSVLHIIGFDGGGEGMHLNFFFWEGSNWIQGGSRSRNNEMGRWSEVGGVTNCLVSLFFILL